MCGLRARGDRLGQAGAGQDHPGPWGEQSDVFTPRAVRRRGVARRESWLPGSTRAGMGGCGESHRGTPTLWPADRMMSLLSLSSLVSFSLVV